MNLQPYLYFPNSCVKTKKIPAPLPFSDTIRKYSERRKQILVCYAAFLQSHILWRQQQMHIEFIYAFSAVARQTSKCPKHIVMNYVQYCLYSSRRTISLNPPEASPRHASHRLGLSVAYPPSLLVSRSPLPVSGLKITYSLGSSCIDFQALLDEVKTSTVVHTTIESAKMHYAEMQHSMLSVQATYVTCACVWRT